MPRQQVYGKRSKAVYTPLLSSSSPVAVGARESGGRRRRRRRQDSTTPEDRAGSRRQGGGKSSGSRVLRERSANEVSGPLSKEEEGDTSKVRRARRRRVVESSDDEERCAVLTRDGNRRVAGSSGSEQSGAVPGVVVVVEIAEEEGVDDKEPIGTAAPETNGRDDAMDIGLYNNTAEHDGDDGMATRASTDHVPAPDIHRQHCASLLSLSLHGLQEFSDWSRQLREHFDVTKIAEASFGEVYRLSLLEDLTDFSHGDESVFKIIALRPPESTLPAGKRKRAAALRRTEAMSKPDEVATEVKLLQRLSSIPGFTNFRDVRVVRGRPPRAFAAAFADFNDAQRARGKEESHFPDPAAESSYADDQLWAVIEMQDAGTDLERLLDDDGATAAGIWFCWDVFWQTVLALAKGEEGAAFEHRDLHLGNICVRAKEGGEEGEGGRVDPADEEVDVTRKLGFTRSEITIIDYTISRAEMQDGTVASQDLAAEPGLFEGDAADEYQYEIYRYMRAAVFLDDPYADFASLGQDAARRGRRSWDQYRPVTNLLWLHFVLYKLLEQLEWPSASRAPPRRLKTEHARWKRANALEHVLLRVQDLLDPGAVCRNDSLRSVGDLVVLALGEGWLDVDSVVGEAAAADDGLAEQLDAMALREEGAECITTAAEGCVEPASRRAGAASRTRR